MIWRLLAAAAALATMGRILFAGAVQLSPDEAYYTSWGRNLALHYRDHPPLIGWIMALVPSSLGGASEVWVRLPALLSGLLMVFLIHVLARSAGASPRSALIASLTGTFSLMGCAGAVIVTPDAPLMLLWSVSLILAVRVARGASPWLLAAASAAAAAACLAKLPGLLLVPGLALAAHARRQEGRRLVGPCVLSALVLVLPLALVTGPASFQLGRLSEASPRPLEPLVFLAAIVGLAGVLPAAGAAVLGPLRSTRSEPAIRVLAWTFWPAVAACTALAAAVHVEPNWGAVAFPSLFAGWAILLDRIAARGQARWLAGVALALNLAVAILVHLHAAGVLAPSLVGRGPAARLHGWREIADVIATAAPGRMQTDDYGLAAPLSHYGRGRIDVILVEDRGSTAEVEPLAVWTAQDWRLGLVRRVEAARTQEGDIRIRLAGP